MALCEWIPVAFPSKKPLLQSFDEFDIADLKTAFKQQAELTVPISMTLMWRQRGALSFFF